MHLAWSLGHLVPALAANWGYPLPGDSKLKADFLIWFRSLPLPHDSFREAGSRRPACITSESDASFVPDSEQCKARTK